MGDYVVWFLAAEQGERLVWMGGDTLRFEGSERDYIRAAIEENGLPAGGLVISLSTRVRGESSRTPRTTQQ